MPIDEEKLDVGDDTGSGENGHAGADGTAERNQLPPAEGRRAKAILTHIAEHLLWITRFEKLVDRYTGTNLP